MAQRRSFIAFLLAFFITIPLGYALCFRLKRGIVAWASMIAAYFLSSFAIASHEMPRTAFFAVIAVLLAFRFIVSLDASTKPDDIETNASRKIISLALIAALFLVLDCGFVSICRSFVLEAFYVPTNSMYPTVNQGERFTASKLFTGNCDIRKGNLVIVQIPGSNTLCVRRIVATQGDHIRCVRNQLFINGKRKDEPYAYYDNSATLPATFDNIEIPADHVFVMGDNRNNSMDSRYHGPVACDAIKGIPTNIFWARHFRLDRGRGGPPIYQPEGIAWERLGLSIRR